MNENIGALKDYEYLFSDEYDEEQAKTDYEEYCRHMEDEMDHMLEKYMKYLDAAYDVKNETLKKHSGEIYNAINIVTEHDQHLFGFLIAGCDTLGQVIPDLNRDLESSIFLSIHANYRAANILLRRWLETTFIAIYYDSKLKKYGNRKNGEKYLKTLESLAKWTKTTYSENFTKNKGILELLLDDDTNDRATQLLNMIRHDKNISFQKCVMTIYSELNQHVHYGGSFSITRDDMSINFVEYNEKCFTRWYNKLDYINDICKILIFLKYPTMVDLHEENQNDMFISFPSLTCAQMSKLKEWQE